MKKQLFSMTFSIVIATMGLFFTNKNITRADRVPKTMVHIGDLDYNHIIDAVDASIALSYYAKVSTGKDGGFTDYQKVAGDVNKDGLIDSDDASIILSYYAWISTEPDYIVDIPDYLNMKRNNTLL